MLWFITLVCYCISILYAFAFENDTAWIGKWMVILRGGLMKTCIWRYGFGHACKEIKQQDHIWCLIYMILWLCPLLVSISCFLVSFRYLPLPVWEKYKCMEEVDQADFVPWSPLLQSKSIGFPHQCNSAHPYEKHAPTQSHPKLFEPTH